MSFFFDGGFPGMGGGSFRGKCPGMGEEFTIDFPINTKLWSLNN